MRKLALIVSLLACHGMSAQPLVLRGNHDLFTTDELGQLYIVKGSELVKFRADGTRFARYSNLHLGDITTVDVTNPLKILLYYRDYQQIVFLDNQLSVSRHALSLQDLGVGQAQLVCSSTGGSFWVFDKMNSELLRFDQSGKKMLGTGNLRQVLQPELTAQAITEHNNQLYLSAQDGVYVFDIYGAFLKQIPLKITGSLAVRNEVLYFTGNRTLCSYDLRTFDQSCDSLPPGVITARLVGKSRCLSYADSIVCTRNP